MVDIEIYRKRLERVEELLSELLEASRKGTIIIVEGKRDILSLKKLGIDGNFELATQGSLLNFAERIASKGQDIIVLTDWDRRGELLALKLSEYFMNLGIKPELQIRNRLRLITQKEIKDVESLHTYVSKLRRITNSDLLSSFEVDTKFGDE